MQGWIYNYSLPNNFLKITFNPDEESAFLDTLISFIIFAFPSKYSMIRSLFFLSIILAGKTSILLLALIKSIGFNISKHPEFDKPLEIFKHDKYHKISVLHVDLSNKLNSIIQYLMRKI